MNEQVVTSSEIFAPYAPPDEDFAAKFLRDAPDFAARSAARVLARDFLQAMRARGGIAGGFGGVEDFLRESKLSTPEGLAVMALAEALVRLPDDATADSLLADKLAAGDFAHHRTTSDAPLVQACAFALGLSAKLVGPDFSARGHAADLVRRLGAPALRAAARRAITLLGGHFVFGETIEAALRRAGSSDYLHSFDMLGEAARTAADAERHFDAYAQAIQAIGRAAQGEAPRDRPGISIKLSALHPRYEAISAERVLAELAPRLLELARLAKAENLGLTVDAEEADRLELSLDVARQRVADPTLARLGRHSAWRCRPTRSARARRSTMIARPGSSVSSCRFMCGWSRAPIGTARSSGRRSAALPTIRCFRARR